MNEVAKFEPIDLSSYQAGDVIVISRFQMMQPGAREAHDALLAWLKQSIKDKKIAGYHLQENPATMEYELRVFP